MVYRDSEGGAQPAVVIVEEASDEGFINVWKLGQAAVAIAVGVHAGGVARRGIEGKVQA